MSLSGGRIGSAWYELELRDQGFVGDLRKMEGQLKSTGDAGERAFGVDMESGLDQATKAADKLDRELDGVDKSVGGVKGSMGGLGGSMLGAAKGGAALGAGLLGVQIGAELVTGLVGKAGEAISLASDKAESASKAQVLFGDSYGIIEEASKGAAEAVGLSSGAYLAAAGDVGNLVVNFGIAGDEAANMSKDIVALAADMGSFNNASTAEVTEAIGAAFRGETEPIRRFGVMIDQAAVATEAVALGLAQAKQPLTAAIKLQATYSLILKQTGKAQGDFARTSDGFANSQRIAGAKMEEAMTLLGEALIPIAAKIMPMVAEGVTALVGLFTDLANVVAPLVDGALSAISDSIDAIGQAFTDLQNLMDPGGTEWERVTAEIGRQAEALDLDTAAVVAFTEAEKRRAEAAAERVRIMGAVAEQDRMMADTIANATAEIEGYIEAAKGASDQDSWNAIIMERKLQLNTQLNPMIEERNRLLGIQEAELAALTDTEDESATVTGRASAALEAYTRALKDAADRQDALGVSIGPMRELLTDNEAAVADLVKEYDALDGTTLESFDQRVALLKEYPDVIRRNWALLPPAIRSVALEAGVALDPLVVAAKATGEGAVAALATAGWAQAMRPPILQGVDAAIQAIGALGPGMRDQLKSARSEIKAAMADLRWAIANPRAWENTLRKVENAIEDSQARIVKYTRQGNTRKLALEQIYQNRLIGVHEQTSGQAYQWGKRITQRHGKGLKDGDGKGGPTDEARELNRAVRRYLRNKDGVYDGGSAIVKAWRSGILSALTASIQPIKDLLENIGGLFGGSLPEHGPLVGTWHGGGDLVRQWTREAGAELPKAEQMMGAGMGRVARRMRQEASGQLTMRGAGVAGHLRGSGAVRVQHAGTVRLEIGPGGWEAAKRAGWSSGELRALAQPFDVAAIDEALGSRARMQSVALARGMDLD